MINHVIRIVTDIVTTTVSVTEIDEVIVAVRKIRPATVTKALTKEAMTMRQKKQANTDSDVLVVILQNKIIFLPWNLYAQF